MFVGQECLLARYIIALFPAHTLIAMQQKCEGVCLGGGGGGGKEGGVCSDLRKLNLGTRIESGHEN